MFATDFQFNNELASSYGLLICNINGNGNDINTVNNAAKITPVLVRSAGSDVWQYVKGNYDEALSTTIQVIKNPCNNSESQYFSAYEQREINRWLNKRDKFYPFKIIKDGFENINFNAQINVNKVEFGDKVIGFELEITTDKPYAYLDEHTEYIDATQTRNFILTNESDEDCEIDTIFKINCLAIGTLRIANSMTQKTMIISDCQYDETILIDTKKRKIVSNKRTSSEILDKFNFVWIKLKRINSNGSNELTINMDANIEVKYSPIAKISF